VFCGWITWRESLIEWVAAEVVALLTGCESDQGREDAEDRCKGTHIMENGLDVCKRVTEVENDCQK
jgi:hypothetical protein